MDLEGLWDKALKQTEIIRARLQDLATFETTAMPYVFLAESSLNAGDTVVRTGQVLVERPSLILPSPQFEGFEFAHDHQVSEDAVLNFLLVRGVRFPSLRYHHELSSLDLRESSLQQAIDHFTGQLKQAEDIQTGLVVGPEDAWQFSILILVGSLVIRSTEGDLRRLLEAWRKRRTDG
ncbi:MAG: hypothetical protein HYZ89_06910 [Candidatus Omnitrophica bacterium]|nr:hypothetical protein [Candidatus Omnitrophota bacterium]